MYLYFIFIYIIFNTFYIYALLDFPMKYFLWQLDIQIAKPKKWIYSPYIQDIAIITIMKKKHM